MNCQYFKIQGEWGDLSPSPSTKSVKRNRAAGPVLGCFLARLSISKLPQKQLKAALCVLVLVRKLCCLWLNYSVLIDSERA